MELQCMCIWIDTTHRLTHAQHVKRLSQKAVICCFCHFLCLGLSSTFVRFAFHIAIDSEQHPNWTHSHTKASHESRKLIWINFRARAWICLFCSLSGYDEITIFVFIYYTNLKLTFQSQRLIELDLWWTANGWNSLEWFSWRPQGIIHRHLSMFRSEFITSLNEHNTLHWILEVCCNIPAK